MDLDPLFRAGAFANGYAYRDPERRRELGEMLLKAGLPLSGQAERLSGNCSPIPGQATCHEILGCLCPNEIAGHEGPRAGGSGT